MLLQLNYVVTIFRYIAPVSRKKFFDIQATIECRFTLQRVRDMIRTYSQMHRTEKCSQHSSIIKLVFSRFFDIRGNLGNVKEKPTGKICCSREKSALLPASSRQNFAWRHFFDVNGVSIVIS